MSERQPPQDTITAVIFDLFGVMIDFDNTIVYQRLAAHCAEPEQALKNLHGLMAGLNVITGRQSLTQTHALLVRSLGLKLSYEEFVVAWNTPYSVPMPGMAGLADRLRPRCKLLLLSNVDSDYWKAIRPLHPELDQFDALVISGEIGLAKPDPRIFAHACRVAETAPQHCLFIDDTARNVEAAQRAGLHGHLFRSPDILEVELRHLGLL